MVNIANLGALLRAYRQHRQVTRMKTMRHTFSSRVLLLAALAAASAPRFAGAALKLDSYNPGKSGIFPVTSVLVSGHKEAVLVDAQFGRSQAEKVVEMIRASGKRLTTIYISHGDPDFYFGLDTIKSAYPDARIVATPSTIAHIKQTLEKKLAYWGPILGQDAPRQAFVPEPLTGDTLQLEGEVLKVRDLSGPQAARSYVWIPSLKAAIGGVVTFNNMHVWMADTQSEKSQLDWLASLDALAALQPETVLAGHYAEGSVHDISAVNFTRDYVKAFRAEAAKAQDAQALIKALKARYPGLEGDEVLKISAKVAKGEMKW
jgi:glyoxylase-like metal-dependent hydrolase (beta-lactamase superfamily II)